MSGADPDRRRHRPLLEDERAIEGLPIRLVIALVVGVAALGIMMNILNLIDLGVNQEVTVNYENPVVSETEDIQIEVVDKQGEEVVNSNVIIRGNTLNTEGVVSAQTGEDSNEVTVSIDSGSDPKVVPDWRSNQDSGTLTVEVIPPSDSDYVDERGNPELTILRDI